MLKRLSALKLLYIKAILQKFALLKCVDTERGGVHYTSENTDLTKSRNYSCETLSSTRMSYHDIKNISFFNRRKIRCQLMTHTPALSYIQQLIYRVLKLQKKHLDTYGGLVIFNIRLWYLWLIKLILKDQELFQRKVNNSVLFPQSVGRLFQRNF